MAVLFTCDVGPVIGQSSSYHFSDPLRINYHYTGVETQETSGTPILTSDGRFVGFVSGEQLVVNDTNPEYDVYVVDLHAGAAAELISVSMSGVSGNQSSHRPPALSADGRYVAFCSDASDLVANDTSTNADVFVRDRVLGTTEMCTLSTSGVQGSAIWGVAMSGDGGLVVFASTSSSLVVPDVNGSTMDVFLRDRENKTTELVSCSSSGIQGNDNSGSFDTLEISPEGRFVCFWSKASNLVPNDTNGKEDIFVRDRWLGQTVRASVGTGGVQSDGNSYNPAMSDDGWFVYFTSFATNLGVGDTNGVQDKFVHDLVADITERMSVSSTGAQALSVCIQGGISPDGRFVSFISKDNGLVPNDTSPYWDAFVHDRLTRVTQKVFGPGGVQQDESSDAPAFSDEGRVMAFASLATNLVPNDTNSEVDVFVQTLKAPERYCTAQTNSLGCVSSIHRSGVPSATPSAAATIGASSVLNQKLGLLVYSTTGFASIPFHGATLCVQPPFRRTPTQQSGGSTTGSDCTGTFAFDFNAWIASGADASLVAGQRVWAQYWSRDPGFAPPNNSNLTDALTFEIAP